MEPVKFCKDCEWFYSEKEEPESAHDPFCMRPVTHDLVLGEDLPLNRHCYEEREAGYLENCGPYGKFWVLANEAD